MRTKVSSHCPINHPKNQSKEIMSTVPKTTSVSKVSSKNVNSYSHFLTHCHTTEHDIDWVLNLRGQCSKPKLTRIPSTPFQTYYKQTESSKTKHTSGDLKEGADMSIFTNLVRSPIAHHTVNFSVKLRESQFHNKSLQRNWDALPIKERGLPPRLLKQASIRKTRGITKNDTQNACEGYLGYPKYSLSSLKDRNFNNVRHLARVGKSYEGLCWESSLRGYSRCGSSTQSLT